VEAANLGIESAKSKRLPDLDASLSFSYIGNALLTDRNFSNVHGLKSPHVGNNFALQAQQVVYAGGAINAGIKLAELGKLQAEVGVKLTRQQARFIALGQYLDLYKIDNRIAGCSREGFYLAVENNIRNSIGSKLHLFAHGDTIHLGFTIVGYHPYIVIIHDAGKHLSRLHQLSFVDILSSHHAVAGSHDDGV
jgi:hypothetical protein